MKKFEIFYHSDHDPLMAVQRYRNRAGARADDVTVVDVDVKTATDDAKGNWNSTSTIECVGSRDGTVVNRAVNPTLEQVDQMIDAL